MDDRQAVKRIKEGDPEGVAVLVKRYQEKAVRAAFAITRDRAVAEDVVQTAFVRLCHTVDSFDMTRPFAPWFLRSVVNAAVKAAKRRQRTLSLDEVVNAETGDTFAELLPDLAALPMDRVQDAERSSVIQAALDKLTLEQRAVVVMRYYLDLETHEISARLDSPAATIRWRLHTAIKRLRGLLPALNED